MTTDIHVEQPTGHPADERRRRRRNRRAAANGGRRVGIMFAMPGTVWLAVFFVAPMYVVLAVVFGTPDPVFRTAVPEWNPFYWNTSQFTYVLTHIFGTQGVFGPALLRTVFYVGIASVVCLVIALPIAYYVSRMAGRWQGLLLALLIAPFWISYMMRMLAWVNLLSDDGLVNRVLSLGGLLPVHVDWLSGSSFVVIAGLVYGYVPYMLIPLVAGLGRLPDSIIAAARDLGAGRVGAFFRVTVPMARPIIVASLLLTSLPMLGDYFTNDLLSGSPRTSMVGNLINETVLTPGQTGQAGALVVLVLLVCLVPMAYYIRSMSRSDGFPV